MNSRVSRASTRAAGLALILLPLLALVVKGLAPGWMLVIIIWSSPLLLLGYALQIVVSAHGLLRERGVLRRPGAGKRGVIAAWTTSVAVVSAAFFLIDGGDDGRSGSPFTMLFGLESTAASDLSMIAFTVSAIIWVAAWLWLVLEWITQLIQASRERKANAAPYTAA